MDRAGWRRVSADVIDIRRFVGAEIAEYLGALATLRIDIFRAFPYLYDGDRTYETTYLRTYVRTPGSVALIAFAADGRVIGASTGAPLAAEPDETRAPFEAAGESVERIFYCGESLIYPAFRGRGIYRRFLEGRETFARDAGFTVCAFCAVDRPSDHPARPPGYEALDAIWQAFGYRKRSNFVARYSWKDCGDAHETEKDMTFWTKALATR